MKNFVIVNEIYLSIDGGECRDIHNTFEFFKVVLDLRRMEAQFILVPYDNVHRDVIELCFQDVNYFQFTENPFAQYSEQIEEVGYKSVGDNDMDWIMPEKHYTDGDHFILRLVNGADLRIGADKMIATVREAKPTT